MAHQDLGTESQRNGTASRLSQAIRHFVNTPVQRLLLTQSARSKQQKQTRQEKPKEAFRQWCAFQSHSDL
jgi:hypothetical protein